MTQDTWTRFYIVRHGETVWNAEGRWQGWLDSPLTPLGQQQAQCAADALAPSGATAIYTSDAGRARQTAAIIGETLRLTPQPGEGFRERFYGGFEGLTSDEIDQRYPRARFEEDRDLRETWRPVNGESLVEVLARVLTSMRHIAASHPGESVIVVTHAGVLRVLDGLASKAPLADIWSRAPGNCAIFVLDANPAGDVRLVQHFSPTPGKSPL